MTRFLTHSPLPPLPSSTTDLQSNMTFSDTDAEATQTVDAQQDVKASGMIDLKLVKFARVNSLTVFIAANAGAPHTKLVMVQCFGDSLMATKPVSELKKC